MSIIIISTITNLLNAYSMEGRDGRPFDERQTLDALATAMNIHTNKQINT